MPTRRELLEDMYPEGYFEANGVPGIKAISLPDTALGQEQLASPAYAEGAIADTAEGPQLQTPPPQMRIVKEREPLLVPDELPEASAPIASNEADPRATVRRQPRQKNGDGGGFDALRAFTSFVGGNEGVATLDRKRAAELAQKLAQSKAITDEKYRASAEKRAEEKWEADKALYPHKASKLEAETGQLKNKTAAGALGVAGTPESKAARESLASAFDAKAADMAGTEWGGRYASYAKAIRSGENLPGMAAIQMAARWDEGVARETALKFKQDDAEADNDLGAQRLSETARHNRATEGLGATRADNSITARIQKDQEKLNKAVGEVNENEELLNMVKEQKKKVNTGWLAQKWQSARKKIGLADKDWDTMEGLLSAVDNQIIKAQAGGNVTAGEAARMRQQLAMMDNDDPEFEDKIDTMLTTLSVKKKNLGKQYQRNPDGSIRDSAPTAKENAIPRPKESTGAEGIDPQKAAKVARAKAILADPNESPEKKAKAQKWLELNK